MKRLPILLVSLAFLLGGCAKASSTSASSFRDDVPELDNAKELEIKTAYANKYKGGGSSSIDPQNVLITGYYGEYHNSYVMFITSGGAGWFMITEEKVGDYNFVYPTTMPLTFYHDGQFFTVTEAASSLLSNDDLSVLYARYSTANENLYK
jgi:hypothetical protein